MKFKLTDFVAGYYCVGFSNIALFWELTSPSLPPLLERPYLFLTKYKRREYLLPTHSNVVVLKNSFCQDSNKPFFTYGRTLRQIHTTHRFRIQFIHSRIPLNLNSEYHGYFLRGLISVSNKCWILILR